LLDRKGTLCLLAVILALCLCAPAAALQSGDPVTGAKGRVQAVQHADTGTMDVLVDGEPVIVGAVAEIEVNGSTYTTAMPGERSVDVAEVNVRFGPCQQSEMWWEPPDLPLEVAWLVTAFDEQPFITVRVQARWEADEPAAVSVMCPVAVPADGQGLVWPGHDPKNVRILENGYDVLGDQFARVVSGAERSAADWNAVAYDLEQGTTLVSGFLSYEFSAPVIVCEPAANGFRPWRAECRYLPVLSIHHGEWGMSELLYLNPLAQDPLQAAEDFAGTVAEALNIKLWPGPVPTGWNYWYIEDRKVNEEMILSNLDFAAAHFKDWGMDYFQIDDGWMKARGDWEPNENFPHGMKWLADEIKKRGFKPGIWYSPLIAEPQSQLVKDHPEWALDMIPAGQALADTTTVLDPSKPEVLAWLEALTEKLVREWGYEWLKPDFTYYALFGRSYAGGRKTAVEAYRDAMRVIREAAGPDCFIAQVTAQGITYGLTDGQRTGFDSWPGWDLPEKNDLGSWSGPGGRGTMPMMRNAIRRWYLNGRVWYINPDGIQMRPPQTKNEVIVRTTATALCGGITKMGDEFVKMEPWQVDAYRKTIPVYPHSARPLDVFTSDAPRLWDLKVTTEWETWHVVGLFNWGQAVDAATSKEQPEEIRLEFARLGLDPAKRYHVFEFWSEKYLGAFTGGIERRLEPRTVELLAIREALDRPQLVSTDRHVTQGAILLPELVWSSADDTLSGTARCVGGARHTMTFFAPDGWRLVRAWASDGRIETSVEGRILRVTLSAPRTGEVGWGLNFERT